MTALTVPIITVPAALNLLKITGLKKTDTQIVHIFICSTDTEGNAHGFSDISPWRLRCKYVIVAAGICIITQLKITGIGT